MTRQGDQKTDVATQDVVKQMLEVVDIYDRAFVAAPPSNDEETEIKTAYENVSILFVLSREYFMCA